MELVLGEYLKNRENIPVMILAGGFGTRLREETEFRPKPMVPIGGRPILWHIMKLYAHHGFRRFIICLGYKGEMIKEYFLNYRLQDVDVTVHTRSREVVEHQINNEDWEITLVNTGNNCMTGGRVARAAVYVDSDRFMLTYGDGVSDVDVSSLLDFHEKHGRLATLTGVQVPFRYGNLQTDGDRVSSFLEKQATQERWINGGFFVFEKEFLRYLSSDDDCVLERQALINASQDGQLMINRHRGFWQCMDTLRDHEVLMDHWSRGAPWKVWDDQVALKPARKAQFVIDEHRQIEKSHE